MTPLILSQPIRRKQNMFNSSVLLSTEVTVEMAEVMAVKR